MKVNHSSGEVPMSGVDATLTRALATLANARRSRRRQRALRDDPTLRILLADLVAARAAAGMTQHEVATRMWTTKSAVSRLESGRYARPTLDTIEKYALAVGARVEIRVRRY
jgi:ribosome-binding protein aMBF1 (putative translation factor)